MTNEELKNAILAGIDGVFNAPVTNRFISAEAEKMLNAMYDFWKCATDDEMTKLMAFYKNAKRLKSTKPVVGELTSVSVMSGLVAFWVGGQHGPIYMHLAEAEITVDGRKMTPQNLLMSYMNGHDYEITIYPLDQRYGAAIKADLTTRKEQ